jgi:hypothetical protein
VAFTSKAFNLVPNDTNNAPDVFYRDNVARTTTLVSMNLAGTGPGDAGSGSPSMSWDGRYVAFASRAQTLTNDILPLGNFAQIYVRDMQLGVTTLVSRATGAGTITNQDCSNPRISPDGTAVVFDTTSTVLDPADVPVVSISHVYCRLWQDVADGYPTTLVDFASNTNSGSGNVANGGGGSGATVGSFKGVPSQDGRFIAFESDGNNLVAFPADGGPDNNAKRDVFIRDTQTHRTVRCSVPGAGFVELNNPLNGDSKSATISADGQTVGFRSVSGILSPIAQETNPNIYVRVWNGGAPFTEVCSVHTSGATGGASCDRPYLTADGTKVVWQSISAALVNGDTNAVDDIFLRDRTALQTTRQSVSTYGNQLNGPSDGPAYSGDGRYIVFYSEATNVVDDQTSGATDIFLRGPPFK